MIFTTALTVASLISTALGQLNPSPIYQPPDPSSGYGNSLSSETQWSNLLGNLLWFYEAQRSGKLPSNNRVSWRNDSALDDGSIDNVDLTGGYYDAGDYIKATYPLAFAIFSVCWGANVYGAAYDHTNQTAYLDEMLRWGLDWLMKAHNEPDSLYVQVGDTDIDNNYWGGDQNIPGPRVLYKVNSTNPGTDISARTAATFASCSALYNGFSLVPSSSSPASLGNSSYASLLYEHATQLYSFSQQQPFQTYTDAISGVSDWAYASSTYQDDQVLANVMMAVASRAAGSNAVGSPQAYLDNATSIYNSDSLKASKQDVVLNWDSVIPAVPVLLTQISDLDDSSMQPSGGISQWRSESETYLDRVVNGKGRGYLTPGGLLYYDGDSDEASLNPAMNAALLCFMYAPLASSSDKTTTYQNFGNSQWNYALGKNPMNVPYIVGSNPNSPTKPHDAKSSGGNNVSTIDTNPVQSLHILYGASVGGPAVNDKFWNIRSDWPEMEVALDYNAPFLTLTAYSVLNDANNAPYFTSLAPGAYDAVAPQGTPCDPAFPCHTSGLSKAAKIAIAVVVTVVGLLIIGLGGCWVRQARRNKEGGAFYMRRR